MASTIIWSAYPGFYNYTSRTALYGLKLNYGLNYATTIGFNNKRSTLGEKPIDKQTLADI